MHMFIYEALDRICTSPASPKLLYKSWCMFILYAYRQFLGRGRLRLDDDLALHAALRLDDDRRAAVVPGTGDG